MVTPAAPSRLTARERARRAARGGASRSVPAPLLVPALIAVAFLVLPLAGLLIRAPWRNLGAALQRVRCDPGARSFAVDRDRDHGDLPGHRGAAGVGAGPEQLPGPAAAPCPGDPAAGAPAGGRRGRAAAGVRPDRVHRPLPGLLVRADDPVHPAGRGHGRDLRGHAVPDHHRRGGAAVRRSGLRGGGGHAGREADDRVPPGHRAHGRPVPGGGRGIVLGTGPGRVRGDDHLRRSFPGQTETMPIAVYYALENDPDAAIALSLVLLVVSVVVLVSLRDRWLRGGSPGRTPVGPRRRHPPRRGGRAQAAPGRLRRAVPAGYPRPARSARAGRPAHRPRRRAHRARRAPRRRSPASPAPTTWPNSSA